MNNKCWSINKKVKFRREYFGGICWFQNGKVFELNKTGISIIELFKKPSLITNVTLLNKSLSNFFETFREMVSKNILVAIHDSNYDVIIESDIHSVIEKNNKLFNNPILKPHWVHIQPFRYCNQRCIHCYCNANNHQEKFPLGLDLWKNIVDYLDRYGIWEVYITGGENFIVKECFELTDYIIGKNLETGISTNGMCVTDSILSWLKESGIRKVQVSLDGSEPSINDKIRGVPGAFRRTIAGIEKLSKCVTPVINTVINRVNYKDIESIIKVCSKIGICEYKFFPQKPAGRGRIANILLDSEIDYVEKRIEVFKDKYSVKIDWPSKDQNCGAGTWGFAIDEIGDVFPCIFGVSNRTQRIASILEYDIDKFWFDSTILNKFRSFSSRQLCNRCQIELK
jgi:MoaA/NifB/PqqE/SkfB family radical SAM enzyme